MTGTGIIAATARPIESLEARLGPVRSAVDSLLDDLLVRKGAELVAVGAELEPVHAAVRRAAAGGKRFRALFCHLGWRAAAAGHDIELREVEVLSVCAALELFHAAALVHDDVMDASATRRGHATPHMVFARHHRDNGLRGQAGRHGEAVATLVGDLAFAWAEEIFTAAVARFPEERRARALFDSMRTQLIAGPYLDLLAQAAPGVAEEELAWRVVDHKAAKYTVAHPLAIGGVLAGAPASLIELYEAVGLAVGRAFQLRDDLLGVFGDPAATGKPSGDDVREGKRTLLVALALQRADPHQRRVLARHLGRPGLDEDQLEQVRSALWATGAVAAVESVIEDQVQLALRLISDAHLPVDVEDTFSALTSAAAWRHA